MLNVITKEAIPIKKKLLEVTDMFLTHIVVTISQVYNYLQTQQTVSIKNVQSLYISHTSIKCFFKD